MTKAELVKVLAEKAGLPRAEASRVLDIFLGTIEETLVSEGKLALTGFGSFAVETRKARVGRNPQTGLELQIPEARVVKFRPSKLLACGIDGLNPTVACGTGGGGPRGPIRD